ELKGPVEVLNLAAPGYDLANSKINYLFSGRSFNPHAVLVYHTWNDFKSFRRVDAGDPPIFAGTVTGQPQWKRLARETQLARRVRNVLYAKSQELIENHYTALEADANLANTPPGAAAWNWFRQN